MAVFSSDSFADDASDSLGNDDQAGAWVTFGGSSTDYSVSSGVARLENLVANSQRAGYRNIDQSNVDLYGTFHFTQVTTSALGQAYLIARGDEVSSGYRANLRIQTNGDVDLRLDKWVTGTTTALGTDAVDLYTGTNGTGTYRMRFQVEGFSPTTLRGKLWEASGSEPGSWQVETTDSEAGLQVSGSAGFRTILGAAYSGATNEMQIDDWLAQSISGSEVEVLLLGGL